MSISLNTKLEVAVQVLSAKIANEVKNGKTVEDMFVQELLKEREEIYSGKEEILDIIISKYSEEIKNKYEEI